jgi:signal transduction histidine kinase
MKVTGQRALSAEAGLENELVLVRLRDSGPGVANPDNLFMAFQPGASSTGLGLYISRAVVRSYGGHFSYESDPKGSCFVVRLWPAGSGDESQIS